MNYERLLTVQREECSDAFGIFDRSNYVTSSGENDFDLFPGAPRAENWHQQAVLLLSGFAVNFPGIDQKSYKVSCAVNDAANTSAHSLIRLVTGEHVTTGMRAGIEATAALSSTGNFTRAKSRFAARQVFDAICGIRDGWAGPGSKGPVGNVIANVQTVLGHLPHSISIPVIELDDSSGYLTLSWGGEGQRFSLTFDGDDHVIGVFSHPGVKTSYAPWRVPVGDGAIILSRISDSRITRLLGGYDLSAVLV